MKETRVDGEQNDPAEPATGSLRGLTRAGEEARRDVIEMASVALASELRLRGRTQRDLTDVDVYAAWTRVVRDMCPSRANPVPALGTGLIAIGSVGVGSMHPYLHSLLQIALLVLFALIGLAGVVLTWRAGRDGGSPETAG